MERQASPSGNRASGHGAAGAAQPLDEASRQKLGFMLQLLDQIAAEDKKDWFKEPVDASKVRGYYDKIQEPMCLDVMRAKLRQRAYRTLRSFMHDMDLVFDNAKAFNAAGHPVHKLAVSMQKTARKLLAQQELECRRALHALHPEGPLAAALEENAQIVLLPGFDEAQAQSLLRPAAQALSAPEKPQQDPPAGSSAVQQPSCTATGPASAACKQQHGSAGQQPVQLQPEDLAAAHTLWDVENQQLVPGDLGLLFQMLPGNSFDSVVQQLRQGVLYQQYSAATVQDSRLSMQQQPQVQQDQQQVQQPEQQPQQQVLQQVQNAGQAGQQPVVPPPVSQVQPSQPPQQQQQEQQQQQNTAAPALPDWQLARQSAAWRCQWLHTRMLELQAIIGLLQTPGSVFPGMLAVEASGPGPPDPAVLAAAAPATASVPVGPAAAAGGANGLPLAGPAAANASAAANMQLPNGFPVLQVQQHGHLLQQHVTAEPVSSIINSPFFMAQLASSAAAAANAGKGKCPEQQAVAAGVGPMQDGAGQQPPFSSVPPEKGGVTAMEVDGEPLSDQKAAGVAAAAVGAAEVSAVAATDMMVDGPAADQVKQEKAQQPAAEAASVAAPPGPPAAATPALVAAAAAAATGALPPAVTVSRGAAAGEATAATAAADGGGPGSSNHRSVYAPPEHSSDPALLFSSLELVEKQLVSARLAIGKAFNIDVSLAPTGVRLGQYAAARLLGPDGALAGAAGGQKRGASTAGLTRGMSGQLAGGARGLQREGSLAGSNKKRRVERSGIIGITGSIDDDGVLSPTASMPSRMVERVAVSIHIPAVRELPAEEVAARRVAATSWHEAVVAQGARQALARPPPEVRPVLEAAIEAEGSSSEDTSDSAFRRMHQPLLEEELIRLNPQGGGRKRNKNKLQQQNSKQEQQKDASALKQQQGPSSVAAAAADEPSSPPAATRQRAKKTLAAERAAAAAAAANTVAAAAPSAVSSPAETGVAGAAAARSTATSSSAAAREAAAAAAKRSTSPSKQSAAAGKGVPGVTRPQSVAAAAPGTTAALAAAAGAAGPTQRQQKQAAWMQQAAPGRPVVMVAPAAQQQQQQKGVGGTGKPSRASGGPVARNSLMAERFTSQPLASKLTPNGPVGAATNSRPGGLGRRSAAAGAGASATGGAAKGAAAASKDAMFSRDTSASKQQATAATTATTGRDKEQKSAAVRDKVSPAAGQRAAAAATPASARPPANANDAAAGGSSTGRGRSASQQPQRANSKSPSTAAGGQPTSPSVASGTRRATAAAAAAATPASRGRGRARAAATATNAVKGKAKGAK